MGSRLSKPTASKSKPSEEDKAGSKEVETNFDQLRERLDTTRLHVLVNGLAEISYLQDEASKAQIDSRQKRTAASLQQQNVWVCDDNFMKLIYKLHSQSFSPLCEDLKVLAQNCQQARDVLGPLEQERMQAERRWEGSIGALQDAEQNIVNEFQVEFALAKSSALSETTTSSYASEVPKRSPIVNTAGKQATAVNAFGVRPMQSDASEASFILDPNGVQVPRPPSVESARDYILSDLTYRRHLSQPPRPPESFASATECDALDLLLDSTMPKNVPNRAHKEDNYLLRPPGLYLPELYDFNTSRERINKWMKQKFLISRLESAYVFKTIEYELDKEDVALPSNWSQLVIAYWALDAAAAGSKDFVPDRDYQWERNGAEQVKDDER